eukprot:s943_g17.t1
MVNCSGKKQTCFRLVVFASLGRRPFSKTTPAYMRSAPLQSAFSITAEISRVYWIILDHLHTSRLDLALSVVMPRPSPKVVHLLGCIGTWAAAFALTRPFSTEDYETMREDLPRTRAFYKAIDALAPDSIVLDLGTGALALLAHRAAAAGARHVYAVEASKFAAEKAAGLCDNDAISVIHGQSQDIELPEKVDVIVHEILGEIASREGVVASLRDAERFLSATAKRKGSWSVPSCARTFLAPAEMPKPRYFKALKARTGTLLAMPGPGTRMLRFPNLPVSDCILAEPEIFEDLHWGEDKMKLLQKRVMRFHVMREGILSGFVFFITVHFPETDEMIPVVSSADEESHWANSFCMVDCPTAVKPGDSLEVESEVDLRTDLPTYALQAKLLRPTGAEVLVPHYVFH